MMRWMSVLSWGRSLPRDLRLLFFSLFLWTFGLGVYNYVWSLYLTQLNAPGTVWTRLLHRFLRRRRLDDSRRDPRQQVRQQDPPHHWMGDEYPCPHHVLLLTNLVRRHSRTNPPSTISVQLACDERVHRPIRRSETDVVSLRGRLLSLPTWSSPLSSCRKPAAHLVEYSGPILVLASFLDRFDRYPLPGQASTTERSGLEGASV